MDSLSESVSLPDHAPVEEATSILLTLRRFIRVAFDSKAVISGSFALWAYETFCLKRRPTWKPADIDVFCRADTDLSRIAVIPRATIYRDETKEFVFILTVPGIDLPIQVITQHSDLSEPINVTYGFDLDICCVVMQFAPEGSNRVQFWTQMGTKEAICERKATFRFTITDESRPFAEKRLVRYLERGYSVRMADKPVDDEFNRVYYGRGVKK